MIQEDEADMDASRQRLIESAVSGHEQEIEALKQAMAILNEWKS